MSDGHHTASSIHAAAFVLRVAAAIVHGVWGYLAVTHNETVVMFTQGVAERFGDSELSDVQAQLILTILGAVTIIAAGLILVAPWRPVAASLAVVGFVVAAIPVTVIGPEAWTLTIALIPSAAVPLALLCLWWNPPRDDDDAEEDDDAIDDPQ